jgi:hypothetical protein
VGKGRKAINRGTRSKKLFCKLKKVETDVRVGKET